MRYNGIQVRPQVEMHHRRNNQGQSTQKSRNNRFFLFFTLYNINYSGPHLDSDNTYWEQRFVAKNGPITALSTPGMAHKAVLGPIFGGLM